MRKREDVDEGGKRTWEADRGFRGRRLGYPRSSRLISSLSFILMATEYAAQVRLSRLIEFGRAFHKRFGLVSFGDSREVSKVEFVDVGEAFDNSPIIKHITGAHLLKRLITTSHGRGKLLDEARMFEFAFFSFNGHLLCDWQDPWKPRAADALVAMFSAVSVDACTLVVNPRDFPWCKKDQSVPWTFVKAWLPTAFFGVPMQRPLSFYGGPDWLDVLMPLPEHWNVWEETASLRRIPRRCDIPVGVFRGTLTGRYLDARNPRVRLCELSKQHPSLLDARLSNWTNRRRVVALEGHTLYTEEALIPNAEWMGSNMTKEEQCAFKVLVYAPGHVAASRLAWQLCSGSAVLMVHDPSCVAPDMWFTTADFDARVARFVNGKFITTPCSIAFSCNVEDALQALDALRLQPEMLERVTDSCVEWASKTFVHDAVKGALKAACERVTTA